MSDRVIVVGGGLAGLATGIYAQRNGYHAVVLERNDQPGGVCASWEREGFRFDGGMHWLLGAVPGHPYYGLYAETGALDRVEVEPIEHLMTLVDEATGASLPITSDLDDLLARVAERFPEDDALVQDLVAFARQLSGFDPTLDGSRIGGGMRSADPDLIALVRHRGDLGALAERSHHRVIREGLLGDADLPVASLAATLSALEDRALARVIGGPRALALGMVDRLTAMGGELRLDADVASIVVEDERAVGVELADGEQIRGDHVISAAPGHTTIFRLLGGQYTSREIRDMYGSWPVSPGPVVLSVGVDRVFHDAPVETRLLLSPPWPVAHRDVTRLRVRATPDGAPEGQSVLQVLFDHDYDFWSELHHTPSGYDQAKRRVASHVLLRLERWFPNLRHHVAVLDVATPYTYWRYTRAWRGSHVGWLPCAELTRCSVPRRIPGLAGFSMAGQWVEPGGGVPTVIVSGRAVIRDLCNLDGRRFLELGEEDPGRG